MSDSKNKDRLALKAGLWYTISNIAIKAIMIISTPIFTRIMTKNDYGVTANFTSWYTLLLTFCTLNLTYSIGRAKLDYKDKLEQYVATMQIVSLLSSIVLVIISFVFGEKVCNWLELDSKLISILGIYLIFAPAIALNQAKFKYQYRYKENIFITLYTTLSTVLLSLILVINIDQNKFYGRILGIVIPTVVLSCFFWINTIRNRYLSFNKEYIKYGLKISLPLVLNGISLNVLAQSDRVVITKYCGAETTAVYTIAYQLAILISIVFDSVGQAWLPWFHDSYENGNILEIKKNIKPLIILGCYVGIGCITIAPEGIMILGGAGYEEGKYVVVPIVLGLVCKFIYANYEHIELHLKKTNYIGLGTVVAAITNIILNIIFVPRYGFIAAGYTTFFTYLMLMTIHLFITRVILKVKVYDDYFMYIAITIETIIGILLMLLYNHMIVRYSCLIILTSIVVIKYRKIVLQLIKKRK